MAERREQRIKNAALKAKQSREKAEKDRAEKLAFMDRVAEAQKEEMKQQIKNKKATIKAQKEAFRIRQEKMESEMAALKEKEDLEMDLEEEDRIRKEKLEKAMRKLQKQMDRIDKKKGVDDAIEKEKHGLLRRGAKTRGAQKKGTKVFGQKK